MLFGLGSMGWRGQWGDGDAEGKRKPSHEEFHKACGPKTQDLEF